MSRQAQTLLAGTAPPDPMLSVHAREGVLSFGCRVLLYQSAQCSMTTSELRPCAVPHSPTSQ